jgi:excisionase family DNA binding protein
MLQRSFYTTFEISQICGVNPTTVQNWVKTKKLKAFQTPGGHRRVRREDLIAFMKKFSMPLPLELASNPPLVMIVDDEEDVLDMLEAMLKSAEEDLDITRAQSGIEALLMIGELSPDLLILDIMMPGMNGYEVCQKLKSNPKTQKIKIVAITGDHNPEVKKRILSAGADMFVSKPLEIIEFRKKCFELLQS